MIPGKNMKRCFYCHRELELDSRPARADTCSGCGSDLKTCLNCAFFDKGAQNQCREPGAEPVTEKDRANFCDFFAFAEAKEECDSNEDEKSDRLADLKKLFGDD